jgi:protein-S-isoprenylcysteine O-methyltransferase Ste14
MPPPILMLILLLVSGFLTAVAPIACLPIPFHGVIATLFILAGVGFAAAGFFSFKYRRTPVRPGAEPTQLVLNGPYRITRNPMYLGLLLTSVGCLFAVESLWFLIPPILFFWSMNFGLIPFEEKLLQEHFGPEYDAYRQRVRRWL